MAYNLLSGALFTPFSYSDLVAPLIQYKEEYDRVEEAYSELMAKAAIWKDEIDKNVNPDAFSLFNNYYGELDSTVTDFSKGMNAENRSALLGLKSRYFSEIEPIRKASEKIEKAKNYQLEVMKANPNAEFEVSFDKYRIDDALKGKEPNINYWDGTSAMARVTAKSGTVAKAIYGTPDIANAESIMKDQYFLIQTLNGMPVDQFLEMLEDPDSVTTPQGKAMAKVLKDELKLANLDRFSEEGKNRIREKLNTAMYAGLAQPTYEMKENKNFASELEWAKLAELKRSNRNNEALGWSNYSLSVTKAAQDAAHNADLLAQDEKQFNYLNGIGTITVDGIEYSFNPTTRTVTGKKDGKVVSTKIVNTKNNKPTETEKNRNNLITNTFGRLWNQAVYIQGNGNDGAANDYNADKAKYVAFEHVEKNAQNRIKKLAADLRCSVYDFTIYVDDELRNNYAVYYGDRGPRGEHNWKSRNKSKNITTGR